MNRCIDPHTCKNVLHSMGTNVGASFFRLFGDMGHSSLICVRQSPTESFVSLSHTRIWRTLFRLGLIKVSSTNSVTTNSCESRLVTLI